MTHRHENVRLPRTLRFVVVLAGFVLTGAVLIWAKAVLVPLTLAVLFTFLLSMPVIRLQRLGVPKIVAVLLIVSFSFVAIGAVGWLVTSQVMTLVEELPNHYTAIKSKLRDVQSLQEGGIFERAGQVLQQANEEVEAEAEARRIAQGGEGSESPSSMPFGVGPIPVVITNDDDEPLTETIAPLLKPLLEPLATAGLVIVLVLFMLLKREDLRNRLVTLSGQTNLAVTTKALDEAGRRISSYLMMQFFINVTYGIAIAAGTWLLGVPYAALWGVAAAILRYIPYVGPWIAAALPIGYSLVTYTGEFPILGNWAQPLGVVALIVVLELFSNNVMEPLLYGRGVGVSEVAVILGAIFWGWLWGPVGLVLATPLTACLVVAGRYVPALAPFNRMLGDAPEVEPHIVYYQRLLARDEDEAEEVFDEQVEQTSLAEACEQVIVPALELAKRDRAKRLIDAEKQAYILEWIAEHLEETPASIESAAQRDDEAQRQPDEDSQGVPHEEHPVVYCYGISDAEDETAAAVLAAMLQDVPCRLKCLSRDRLISEVIDELRNADPAGLCLIGIPPGGLTHARGLCKRFRTVLPDLKIAVARWGPPLNEKAETALRKHGATYIGRTPAETRDHVESMMRLRVAQPETAGRQETATVDA